MIPGQTLDLSWEGSSLFSNRADYSGVDILLAIEVQYGRWSDGEWRPAPTGAPPGATFVVNAQRGGLGDPTTDWSYGSAVGSPDNNSIVAGCFSQEAGGYWCLVSRQDSSRTLVASRSEGYPLGWAEDGTALYWQSGSDIFTWNLEEDERLLLVTLPPDLSWIGGPPVLAPSNCRPRWGVENPEFVCAIKESYTDLFLVENFDPNVN